jgi:HPt (histidine-containing phosphotransfer) domain-containing protein
MKVFTGANDNMTAVREGGTLEDAAAPPLAPGEPVIDLAHLDIMTLGERNLEREVLTLFDQQAEMLLARMAREQPRVVAALAHTLSGSARGIGAWRVAAAAMTVERLATPSGAVMLTGAMDGLAAAVAEARAAIADILQAR